MNEYIENMINEVNNSLKAGDIVFIAIPNFLYRRVAKTTCSWTSHVGMVHSRQNGQWLIAESSVPFCKMTPLENFLERSENGTFAIKRLKNDLSEYDISRLQASALKRMKRLYHLGFKYESNRQFCSKFVYEVFKEALDIEVGQLETFRDLLNKNPEVSKRFWKFWFFGFIPWKRLTVTPASVMESPKLQTIFEVLN